VTVIPAIAAVGVAAVGDNDASTDASVSSDGLATMPIAAGPANTHSITTTTRQHNNTVNTSPSVAHR
jgi:hypothetical protein